MTVLIQIALGALIWAMGRRLYWLLAAGAGYLLGLSVLPRLAEFGDRLTGVLPLALAVVFAVVAVLGHRLILSAVGFIAGGAGLLNLIGSLSLLPAEPSRAVTLAIFVVGGLIGAFLLSRLWDIGLIVLSSLLGAVILLAGLNQVITLPTQLGALPLLALTGLGILIQFQSMRKSD